MSRYTRTGWAQVPVPFPLSSLSPATKAYQRECTDGGHLSVFVGPEPDGFHLSISHRVRDHLVADKWVPGRYPTWDEVVEARYEFCPKDMTMAMFLPPKEEYVNVHETTFHLWEVL